MTEEVLVVENDSRTRKGMCAFFTKAGMPVRSAQTIQGALRELPRMPSLVVLDLSLPDGNGIKVLEAIREVGLPTKVAVVSSASDSPSTDWIRMHRPDAVFGKPFDFADFADWLTA